MKAERKCRARQSSPTKARPLSGRASPLVAHHAHATDSVAQVPSKATGATLWSKQSIDGRRADLYIPGVSGPAYMPNFHGNLSISNRELTMRRASASRAQRGICSAADFAKGTSAPSRVTRPACRQRAICSALSNRELTMRRASASRAQRGICSALSNRELTMRRASASRAQRGICSALSNRELLGLEHAATY